MILVTRTYPSGEGHLIKRGDFCLIVNGLAYGPYSIRRMVVEVEKNPGSVLAVAGEDVSPGCTGEFWDEIRVVGDAGQGRLPA